MYIKCYKWHFRYYNCSLWGMTWSSVWMLIIHLSSHILRDSCVVVMPHTTRTTLTYMFVWGGKWTLYLEPSWLMACQHSHCDQITRLSNNNTRAVIITDPEQTRSQWVRQWGQGVDRTEGSRTGTDSSLAEGMQETHHLTCQTVANPPANSTAN